MASLSAPPGPPISSALAGAVLDALPDATAVVDQAGVIIAVNHAWRMFSLDNGGDEAHTGVGVSYLDVCARSVLDGCPEAAVIAADLRGVLAGEQVEAEAEYPCPSPALRRWFLLRTTKLEGEQRGAVISHVNITRRKMAEDELSHSASHDPLTGLANRSLLEYRLRRALGGADRRQLPDTGVVFIDLDGFKAVNDTFGHAAGDEVLMTVAARLRDAVRTGATVARLGGDEFVVLAPRIDADALAALAGRIDRILAEPHHLHGSNTLVPGSVGTHLAAAGETGPAAMASADQAMYAAKRAGSRRRAEQSS